MSSWRQFFDGDHAIYVNETHRQVHDRAISGGIIGHVEYPDTVLLDYACGEATQSDRVLDHVSHMILCEGAPSIIARLKARYGTDPRVSVITPEEMGDLAPRSVDLIMVSSFLQYVSKAEAATLFARWHDLLSPRGKLVLADVLAPDITMLDDIRALLLGALRNGYLMAACLGLVKTFFSPYRTLRQSLGLTTYEDAEMIALLESKGFAAQRFYPNFGLSPHRRSFVARLR